MNGTSNDDLEVGERWAYRARGVDPLVEVEVLKLGTNRPARVRVRFVDETFEGREDWVTGSAQSAVGWRGRVPGVRGALGRGLRRAAVPDRARGRRGLGGLRVRLRRRSDDAQLRRRSTRHRPDSRYRRACDLAGPGPGAPDVVPAVVRGERRPGGAMEHREAGGADCCRAEPDSCRRCY